MFAITPRAVWAALLGAGCSGEATGPESPASPALSPSAGKNGVTVIAVPAPPEATSHEAGAVAPLAPRPEAVPQMSVDPPSDVADPPADATRTRSGVAFKVLKKGQGTRHPAATDRVVVHSSGWTADGRLFDSSLPHGKPFVFDLRGVIPGYAEGVQLMVVGDRIRLWVPANLAYWGTGPQTPQGRLTFDVELLEIEARESP